LSQSLCLKTQYVPFELRQALCALAAIVAVRCANKVVPGIAGTRHALNYVDRQYARLSFWMRKVERIHPAFNTWPDLLEAEN
jgi:hypothetical protein